MYIPGQTQSEDIHKELWEPDQFQASSYECWSDHIIDKKSTLVWHKQAFPAIRFVVRVQGKHQKSLSTATPSLHVKIKSLNTKQQIKHKQNRATLGGREDFKVLNLPR